ncbi:MAG TPA: exonuclease domain-containing protein [Miltoncostaeaceae bacterium]|nr:exonuclease domain-containing protein [Miltoncostaeaceae bacterium]
MSVPGQLLLPIETPRPAGAAPALSDRLCALIVRRGRPLETGHVAAQLLGLRRCPEGLQRRLVAEIVASDGRLAWLGRDLVGLAPPAWATSDVRDTTFCVVDLETTGGAPGASRITEIGAVRVTAGRIVERFTTLVDPGVPIPAFITGITGIDDAMVAGMPDIAGALGLFTEFAGQDVLVAHNAPFDLRFLNYERRRLLGTYFTQPWLDTLALSRRLLGGRVGRHDLATLADWAATVVRPCHRALPDAEATAELLVRLLEMLAEHGHDTLERAVAFAAPGGTRYAYKLALAEDLPTGPGVYLMRDRDGDVLYIGKARDLRRRVRAYFGPGGRHGRLIGRAIERLERVDHECCDTELDALLREGVLLRRLRPPCNRRGLGAAARYLWLPDDGSARPRVTVTAPTTGVLAGPVRPGRALERALGLLAALYPEDDAHAHAEVADLLGRDPVAGLGALGRRLAAAAGSGAWTAERDEDRARVSSLVDLARGLARMRALATRRAVLCEPVHGGGVALFGVAGGRVVRRVLADDGSVMPAAAAVLDAVRRRRIPEGPLPLADLDEALIVDARARELGGRAVPVAADGPRRPDLERIAAAAAAAAVRRRAPALAAA